MNILTDIKLKVYRAKKEYEKCCEEVLRIEKLIDSLSIVKTANPKTAKNLLEFFNKQFALLKKEQEKAKKNYDKALLKRMRILKVTV